MERRLAARAARILQPASEPLNFEALAAAFFALALFFFCFWGGMRLFGIGALSLHARYLLALNL